MYYNTNKESGETLKKSRNKAQTQNEMIFKILGDEPEGLTPYQIHVKADLLWPITSIRRALSTLTKAGKLTKTDELRLGPWKKNEHVWKIKGDE
jgi:Fe2+ or Zn2+ uptake regulation protein